VLVLSRADFLDQIGVNRGYWLLHEMQGPARNPERKTDHDEKWSASYRGRLSSLRHKDLQDRCWEVVLS
jgi:hypothetical protein